ncbi:contact-dependent growth inhibition system immunity protein [Pectobacterium wasabiae]|uniref:Uncharacterized protein n=1 Tax=Pectobacterium wasabiae TaxID=55208 RepID=A0AAW3ECI6_9GAMM|nr:contact-dependent growth inhibition system immunity protein [Pectobacterium wasabiae]AOR65485.1 hypothetical protein A7983_19910 [Pectobacterium wasabiae CFBP 3304]EJS93240.1 Hypothetical protein Y17_3501 [Pectobacterium wasabiae CFBP 3304]KFX02577.1 hypothetical protein JV38_21895 [Pectobacterium wasabiae]KGA26526.1 hypothetical protein KU73_21265 [Pectobacterium wasabiae]
MTTFRELLLISNSNYDPNKRSSLDEWFSGILDAPLDELDVSDVARAIRQDLFLADVLPKAEIILKKNPLAGYDYDGQLISSIVSLNSDKIKVALPCFRRVSSLLSQLDKNNLDAKLVMDIEKIEKLSRP